MNTNSKKFKNGKEIKNTNSYKFSGLQRKEKELVSTLVRKTEVLSLIHEDIHKKIELPKLSQKEQVVALLYELKFMREFFIMTVEVCHAIGILQSEQEAQGSAGGRKKKLDERKILIQICVSYYEQFQKLPTGQVLLEKFEKFVEPINKERKMTPISERSKQKQVLKASSRFATKFLADIRPYF